MHQLVNVPTHSNGLLFALYYAFKILPILAGAMSIYLGYRLFILGVTGQASLSVDVHSVKGQLLNAAPGAFFAVGGVAAIIVAVWKGVQIRFQPHGTFSDLQLLIKSNVKSPLDETTL